MGKIINFLYVADHFDQKVKISRNNEGGRGYFFVCRSTEFQV